MPRMRNISRIVQCDEALNLVLENSQLIPLGLMGLILSDPGIRDTCQYIRWSLRQRTVRQLNPATL